MLTFWFQPYPGLGGQWLLCCLYFHSINTVPNSPHILQQFFRPSTFCLQPHRILKDLHSVSVFDLSPTVQRSCVPFLPSPGSPGTPTFFRTGLHAFICHLLLFLFVTIILLQVIQMLGFSLCVYMHVCIHNSRVPSAFLVTILQKRFEF